MKQFLNTLKIRWKILTNKKMQVFNVLLEHDFNVVDEKQKETLVCEISVVARSQEHARKIAELQMKQVNDKLASNFRIDKLWKLKQSLNVITKDGKRVSVHELSEDEFNKINFTKHFQYLSEEFNYCKEQDDFCSLQ